MHDWVLVTPRHPHHLKAYEVGHAEGLITLTR